MHANTVEAHAEVATKGYFYIWGWLLAITGLEVYLAYIHFTTAILLLMLMSLSVVKAGLIMAYFMHLKFERLSLILTLVPVLLAVISLLAVFFPDSLRLLQLRR